MAGRVKIKSKVVNATLDNRDVLDMFHGVLGTSEGGATLSVAYPKYNNIKMHVERFLRLLSVLHESTVMALFPSPREHLDQYRAALQKQFDQSFSAPDLAPFLAGGKPPGAAPSLTEAATVEALSKIPPTVIDKFMEVSAAAKKCSLVNTIVVVCKNLVPYKKSLHDQANLRDKFLVKDGGMSLCPLPDLPQVNFKQIYIDDRLTADNKKFVLVVLHKLYSIGHDVYEAVSSPDVDVGEFVQVIMSSIGEVRKHIPRCDQAFDKILESVDLLRGNFGSYYKDYVASSNPTIIMENFVLDVSKNTKASPQVTGQFRRIIQHYRTMASQQSGNPKLQSLFKQVDANFQELESKSKEADEDEEDSSDEESKEPAPGPKEATTTTATTATTAAPPQPPAAKKGANPPQKTKAAPAKPKTIPATQKPRAGPPTQAAKKPRAESLLDELEREDRSGPGTGPGSGTGSGPGEREPPPEEGAN